MSIINATVVRQAEGTWLFTWDPGSSPYSVWLDGELLESGLTDEEYEYTGAVYPDEAPPLEIIESGDTAENDEFPPYLLLQWWGLQDASGYMIEQYVSGSWIEEVHIMERARGYYSWATDPLEDGSSHQFRITAVGLYGNEGTPVAFTTTICRNPEPPDVDIVISGGDVVISEA